MHPLEKLTTVTLMRLSAGRKLSAIKLSQMLNGSNCGLDAPLISMLKLRVLRDQIQDIIKFRSNEKSVNLSKWGFLTLSMQNVIKMKLAIAVS